MSLLAWDCPRRFSCTPEANLAIKTKMTGANNRRDALLAGFRAGNFLETVYACLTADPEERENVALELAALHNEGLIDVVAAFDDLKNKLGMGRIFS